MSRFGETADKVLETLQNGEMKKSELMKMIYVKETEILDFLEEYGLIELNMDYVSITKSGRELLTAK
jgi:hypothetical protein